MALWRKNLCGHHGLLLMAILLTLAAVTSVIPIKYMVELRVFYSIAMGIALGVYISTEYFLQTAFLHILIVVTMVSASVFVVFTHFSICLEYEAASLGICFTRSSLSSDISFGGPSEG